MHRPIDLRSRIAFTVMPATICIFSRPAVCSHLAPFDGATSQPNRLYQPSILVAHQLCSLEHEPALLPVPEAEALGKLNIQARRGSGFEWSCSIVTDVIETNFSPVSTSSLK